MNKHTPGPWGLYYNSQNDVVVRKMLDSGLESHVVARVNSGMADARLIAAAPELLECLEMMTTLCRVKYGNLDPEVYSEIEKARAAIAKARGEK